MKINESTSTATIVGDVQSNAVSIDVNNIGFITQLLSTNLYSRPIESFLREIVSNAWDSHVEAGVNEPIILELGTDTEGRDYCRIQDFGIGLSPERFNDVYRNIGSSTKRTDNTQIGGFGIGRFSALAYSGTVYLTSNYKGIKYKYLMYKDGNNIKIDELLQLPTTDRDGLEVLVYVKYGDIPEFTRAIKSQLCYFENLYITADRYGDDNRYTNDTKEFAEKFNNLKIKKYNTFSVNTFYTPGEPTTLCLGKIQYPLNLFALTNTKFKFSYKYPITVNFGIGELDVTPNREQLLYTKSNIEKIEKQLDKVQDELDEIISKQTIEDFDNFAKYIDKIRNPNHLIYLYESEDNSRSSVVFVANASDYKITFKGKKLPDYTLKLHQYINYLTLPAAYYSGEVTDGRIVTKTPNAYYTGLRMISDRIGSNFGTPSQRGYIFFGNVSEFNGITKDYIREHCLNETIFIKLISKRALFRFILKSINTKISSDGIYHIFRYNKEIIKLTIDDLLSTISKIQIVNDSCISTTYIEERKQKLKEARELKATKAINWSEEINLYIVRGKASSYPDSDCTTTDSERFQLDELKGIWSKFPVIYAEKNTKKLRQLYTVFNSMARGNSYMKYYKFVEVAPTKLKILEQFPNFIKLNDFMDVKYKKIRMLATANILNEKYNHLTEINSMGELVSSISPQLREVSKKVTDYIRTNVPYSSCRNFTSEVIEEIVQLCKDNNYFDEEMMGYINENIKLIENSRFIPHVWKIVLPSSINFIVDYILARKLFIPNIETVKKLREETILNIKKR